MMHPRALIGSAVLDTGKTPAEWVAIMAERGIAISERTLRAKANALGACYKLSGAMIITPEQIDTIFMEGQPCRSNTTAGAEHSGSVAASNSTAKRSPTTTGKALDHLRKQALGTGLPPKQIGKGVVTSLETTRR